jgi:RHS repeat-associated protein
MFGTLEFGYYSSEFITEDFSYAGLGGRMSDRTTTMLDGAGHAVGGATGALEHWGYNALGLVIDHKHPRVRGLFDESLAYSYGRLSSLSVSGTDYDTTPIAGMVVTPTFRPAGNLGSYTVQQTGAPNSLVTIIYQDTSGIPRPRQIQSSSTGGFLFDTGNITYDAAGNITAMGADTFKYDSVSRLLSDYEGSGTTCTDSAGNANRNQCFTYDRWGNLTSVAGVNARSLPAASATNQSTIAAYDSRGNLTQIGGEYLCYDDSNRQTQDGFGGTNCTSGTTWQYLYGAPDERIARIPNASGASVPRREIARLIVQGKNWTPGSSCTEGSPFGDVHCTDPDWGYIDTISVQNLTAGCGGGNYCPDAAVARNQAAVLFLKAEHGSTYTPPACVPNVFTDVSCSDPTAAWVEQAVTEQVMFACAANPTRFCPSDPLTEFTAAEAMGSNGIAPTYRPISGGTLYTLRNSENQVVTEMADSLPQRDNIYVGNALVASYLGKQPGGSGAWRFHASDHLGTIRLTVDGATVGSVFSEAAKYWPYGEPQIPAYVPAQRIAFAAMERDPENSHFYDHARHHDYNLIRFVVADNAIGQPANPQTWNRYTYSLGSPVTLLDPNGHETNLAAALNNAYTATVARLTAAGEEFLKSPVVNYNVKLISTGELKLGPLGHIGAELGFRNELVEGTTKLELKVAAKVGDFGGERAVGVVLLDKGEISGEPYASGDVTGGRVTAEKGDVTLSFAGLEVGVSGHFFLALGNLLAAPGDALREALRQATDDDQLSSGNCKSAPDNIVSGKACGK